MRRTLFIGLSAALVSTLSTATPVAANILTNGDFSDGNSGFSSEYVYNPGNVGIEGAYDIVSDPFDSHPSAVSYGDHTTGIGLMLVANGSTVSNTIVWSQAVSLSPGAVYDFTFFGSTWSVDGPSQDPVLRVFLDGVPISSAFLLSAAPAMWTDFTSVFVASGSSAVLSIVDLTTTAGGNDFALDDLSLVQIPEPKSLLLVGMGLGAVGILRRGGRLGEGARPS